MANYHCCSRCGRCHANRKQTSASCSTGSSCSSWTSTSEFPLSDSHSSVPSASASYHSGSGSGSSLSKSHRTRPADKLFVLPLRPAQYENPQHCGRVFNVVEAGMDDGAVTASVRWLRRGHYCDHDHLSVAVRAAKKAQEAVLSFQRCVNTRGWKIHVLQPRMVRTRSFLSRPNGTTALLELCMGPMHKYNSNSGWTRDMDTKLSVEKTPNRLLQALSHYSFAWSEHQLAVCNLRAYVNHSEKKITLSLPTIITTSGEVYGCEDLGMKGLRNFFEWHTCNQFCDGYAIPKRCAALYDPVRDTLVNKGL